MMKQPQIHRDRPSHGDVPCLTGFANRVRFPKIKLPDVPDAVPSEGTCFSDFDFVLSNGKSTYLTVVRQNLRSPNVKTSG